MRFYWNFISAIKVLFFDFLFLFFCSAIRRKEALLAFDLSQRRSSPVPLRSNWICKYLCKLPPSGFFLPLEGILSAHVGLHFGCDHKKNDLAFLDVSSKRDSDRQLFIDLDCTIYVLFNTNKIRFDWRVSLTLGVVWTRGSFPTTGNPIKTQ